MVDADIYDVLVAGGGPAGSTAAALLATSGRRVCLLEKDVHPRFHIGESLLPWNVPILERLGLTDEIEKIGVVKRAADFSTPDSDRFVRFDFSEAFSPTPPTAFQVRRSEFDHLLIRNAERAGADVIENARITNVDLDGGLVSASFKKENDETERITARFIIDASGRDTLLSRQLKLKQRHPSHRSAAVYGHFDNVTRREGQDWGNISIYWFDEGWIWMIPLHDGPVSIGVVAEPEYFQCFGDGDAAFNAALAACPPASRRVRAAERKSALRATGNFSYFSDRMYGPNFLLVGDAFAFIDPVFSSGVYVAMSSAEKAAAAVEIWLGDERRGIREFAALEKETRRGINRLWWFISRFRRPTLQRMFMAPRNILGLKGAVLSTLGGDIYGNPRLWLPLALFRTLYRILEVAERSPTRGDNPKRRRLARLQNGQVE